MYATCLYCLSDLGRNEVVEHFPVGRRLAFDADKGRLWVVCRKCERWNLSPLEERWEAIEECERLFRGTKLRVSTDNIGLARVAEGLELVRIGQAQRPEMAAWRYGDQFGRRRTRYYTITGVAVAGVVGLYVAGPVLGLYAAGGMGFLGQMPNLVMQGVRRVAGRVKLPMPGSEKPVVIEHDQVSKAAIVPCDEGPGWALRVPIHAKFVPAVARDASGELRTRIVYETPRKAQALFTGDEAIRVAGRILPKINMRGAARDDVQRAVALIQDDPDPARFFQRHSGSTAFSARREPGLSKKAGPGTIARLPGPVRLALEMSAHEDTERRALEGELAMLEAAWKEAEEVAAISDNLLVPDDVDRWLARFRLRG